jgi:Uma2 family endonuclease
MRPLVISGSEEMRMSQTTDQPIMVDLRNFGDGVLTEERIAEVRAELRETDGEPLESPWHRACINLMIDAVIWHRRGKTTYFVGGNMFIYYSRSQAKYRKDDYKGPDFFLVNDVDGTVDRLMWWVFEEDNKFPDVIIELLSPATAEKDRTTNKDIYEKDFRTPEYFYYDPETKVLSGFRLQAGQYQDVTPNEKGRYWSEELGLWVGTWDGVFQGKQATWLRFYDADGNLVLTEAEAQARRADEENHRADEEKHRADEEKHRADEEKHRADEEKHRADALAAELARLQALLTEKGISPDQPK